MMLMPREGFYIIRCPKCGRFTYAPTRQKTRLCVYCQRIFRINPLGAVFVADAVTARTKVKFFQTGKHHREFMALVEKSREKIQSLIPVENVDLEQLQDSEHRIQPASARRREFERILHQKARKKPLDLHVLEEECLKSGIPWDWATQQIESLIRSGHIISPKPWQVMLIVDDKASADKEARRVSPTRLARIIGNILRNSGNSLSYDELVTRLEEQAVSNVGTEEALDLLRNQGYILKTAQGTYQWIGDWEQSD